MKFEMEIYLLRTAEGRSVTMQRKQRTHSLFTIQKYIPELLALNYQSKQLYFLAPRTALDYSAGLHCLMHNPLISLSLLLSQHPA
jgi:hypothetical protein